MLTMLLGGLWHGASWSFVLWGALNGFYLSVEKLVNYHQWVTRSTFHRIFGAFITFHCICLTWVYIRADSFAKANTVVGKAVLGEIVGPDLLRPLGAAHLGPARLIDNLAVTLPH